MRTLITGCNHRYAPVALREKLAFDEAQMVEALRRFHEAFPEAEAVLVSTCNRVEFYFARPVHGHPRIGEVIEFIARFHDLHAADLSSAFYNHEDAEAIRHLFRVTSSLDSMVLGESQILSQVRTAFEAARRQNLIGTNLGDLFQRAFAVAKEIHTRTAIATGRVSVGSVAVDLARQVFSRFDDKTVLMVGAGKMGEVTLKHLLATRPRRLWITNRSPEKAHDLADRIRRIHQLQVQVIPFEQWIAHLAAADIAITSTGSREPVLTAKQFAPVPARRQYRPLLIIDIAVPRDIDSAVGKQDSVFLYNIDDLQIVTEATLIQRREALSCCQGIIESHVTDYLQSRTGRDLGPVLQALRDRLQGISEQELHWLLPKLQNASAHDREMIERMLHRIAQKILHHPTDLLRRKITTGTAGIYADTLAALFALKLEADEPPASPASNSSGPGA
ncbi:MAG TPA: glutamyl-tRNA reductase [Phycisphaerae bacterium]|nr:glutamyl-tRNA reductase [Phycisphaerae bacterium]